MTFAGSSATLVGALWLLGASAAGWPEVRPAGSCDAPDGGMIYSVECLRGLTTDRYLDQALVVPPSDDGGERPAQSNCDFTLMDVLVAQKRAIADCITKQYAGSPHSSGIVKVHWRIHPDGHVSHVHVVNPRKVPIEPCMVDLIKRLKFPPHSGRAVDIDFPFKY